MLFCPPPLHRGGQNLPCDTGNLRMLTFSFEMIRCQAKNEAPRACAPIEMCHLADREAYDLSPGSGAHRKKRVTPQRQRKQH